MIRPSTAFLPLLLLLGLFAVACGPGETEAPDEEPQIAGTTGEPSEEAPPPPARPELRASELDPQIRELGPERSVPTRLVVRFARAVADDAQVGSPLGEGTRLTIEPPVEGELTFTSSSVLTFVPAQGFAPATEYNVELAAVETYSGVVETPSPGRWSRTFQTPGFDFVRASLQRLDLERKNAEVELEFSAAVDPSEVQRYARFWVIGPRGERRSPNVLRTTAGDEPTQARVVLASSTLEAGGRIEVKLDGGLPSAANRQLVTREARTFLEIETGPEVRLLAAYRGESASGHYVQVICDDGAVASKRGYWDDDQNQYYQNLSTRCEPEELGTDAIRFDPPIAYSVSPSRGGFRLFGNFERGTYKLRIDAGLQTVDGGTLPKAFEHSFEVPARSAQLRFVSKGRYLPREAWRSLPLRHLNVGEATLEVRHVPAENLVFWMSDENDESATERTSNLVVRRELALGGETDEELTTYVDLGALVPASTKGLLELTLQGAGARDTARIVLTDLHLVAKRAGPIPDRPWGPEIDVWTLDVTSLEPVRRAEVQLVKKSGYVVASCNTSRGGGCKLELPAKGIDPSEPFALVARRGDDLTYLRFQDLEVEIQEARVAGDPYRGERKYRAAVYGERGVYRPGETARLAAIVRGEDDLAPPEGMPVVASLVDPRGRTLRRQSLSTNAAGYVTFEPSFAAFATTGRYELQLEAGNRRIGQHRFQVEEFVPERMRVEAAALDGEYLLGEAMKIEVDARYLFGGVPEGNAVELSCELEPSSFDPPENASYHYGVWEPEEAPRRPLGLGTVQGQLDAEGHTSITCPGGGRGGGFRGPATLVARAAVFEAGSGRTSVGRAEVPVHPERYYLGLETGATKLEAGDELAVEGVVVDWRGNPHTEIDEIELQFVRLEWEWGWYHDEALGHETFRRYHRPVVEVKQQVPVAGGKFKAAWTPSNDAPAFVVRAISGEARTEVEIEGKASWYYWSPEESQVDQTPRPGRPTWLALDAPEGVRVGEPFPVRFNVPHTGRVLLTLETDRVVWSEWREMGAGEAVWMAELDEFYPNVYATAFLIKDPYLESADAFLPDRAFGVTSVRVEPVDYTQELEMRVPKEVRSQSRLAVELDLGKLSGPTWATVAAVDEGILSLTRFESPDPLKEIFARRALGVETFETVGWTLLVPPGGPSSTTGGDGGGDLGRVQPVKPVALWSGLVEVDDDGRAEIGFDLPPYRGELRVMAVTAGPQRIGHAAARVTVSDPLVVQSTLPRFLTRGDEVDVPVSVTNLSGDWREVEIEIGVENLEAGGLAGGGLNEAAAVELLGPTRQSLELADGASGVLVFRARALQPTGAVTMKVTARSDGLTSEEATDVPLLPTGPKSRVVERFELSEGELDLGPHLEGWLPLSERTTFRVTPNPYGDAFTHLGHLVRYPYGCLEQTTSSTRPLLYLGDLIPRVDPDLVDPEGIEEMVKHGIDRLLGMQSPAGGFNYWPGGRPAYWATAYATHLLLDAQKLRYPVPQEAVDDALSWMENQVNNYYAAGRDDWYSSNGEPYMHYVLALAGRAKKGRIQTLLGQLGEGQNGEEREQVFLLRAALYLAGDHRYESQLRNPDLTTVADVRRNGWSFYSDRRRRGMMLAVAIDLFGRDPGLEPLANLVAGSLRAQPSRWYTTQELVWGITGLGKFVDVGAREFEPPVLRAGGKRIAPEVVPDREKTPDLTWQLARASEYESVTMNVPKKGEGKLFLILSSEGVRAEPDWRTGGAGLSVARRYLDSRGQPLEGGSLKLGELVYVELELRNTTGDRIANVALVDRIPAGWEIENPRLGRGGQTLDWVDTDRLWEADHLDLRDDRLEIFGHLDRGESRKVVYAVRAVSAGSFNVPPVEAEAMYEPRIWAREMGRKAEIRGPWSQ